MKVVPYHKDLDLSDQLARTGRGGHDRTQARHPAQRRPACASCSPSSRPSPRMRSSSPPHTDPKAAAMAVRADQDPGGPAPLHGGRHAAGERPVLPVRRHHRAPSHGEESSHGLREPVHHPSRAGSGIAGRRHARPAGHAGARPRDRLHRYRHRADRGRRRGRRPTSWVSSRMACRYRAGRWVRRCSVPSC